MSGCARTERLLLEERGELAVDGWHLLTRKDAEAVDELLYGCGQEVRVLNLARALHYQEQAVPSASAAGQAAGGEGLHLFFGIFGRDCAMTSQQLLSVERLLQ